MRLKGCLCWIGAPSRSHSRRTLASAAASTSAPPPAHQTPPTQTAELLHNTVALLKRYPLLDQTSWSTRLDSAVADLQHQRRARVAVAGEREAGAPALVSAAFDDPLSSDEGLSVALASRRLGNAPEAIALTYAIKTATTPHEIGIPSNWLRDNNTDVVEVVFSVPPQMSSLDLLHLSDATILVVSELVLLSPPSLRFLLLELSGKPNLFLALNVLDPSHTTSLASLSHTLSTLLPGESHPRILLTSTFLATTGLLELSSPTPSYSVFQTNYNSSGITALKDELVNAVSGIHKEAPKGSTAPSALQLQTADYILEKAINAITFQGARIEDELSNAGADVASLDIVGQEAERRVLNELGVRDGALKIPEEEVLEARKALDHLFESRLVWWKLPVMTDDIVHEVSNVVDRTYLPHFEARLIFDTGRLMNVSTLLSSKIDDLLSTRAFLPPPNPSPPPSFLLSSLYSPLMLNKIDAASLACQSISSSALSSSLIARRKQITAKGGPAEVAQGKAQKIVVSATSLTGGSLLAGVAGQLAEFAEVGTSLGIGMFGTVLAAWIAQRKWSKVKKHFLIDVEQRVTGGLEDDLGAAAQRLVDRALYPTRTTVAGASELLRKRKAAFDSFAVNLAQIERKRRGL
ncbi:hypothetical protein P7C70_g6570, partial [Phenoliferia sp. Uapishka_3]